MFAKIAFQESKDGALISATNDEEAIEIFYAEKKVSTRNAFEREIRRFCYWMEAQGLTLKALTHAHVKAYKTLLSSPPSEACGPPVKYYLDAGKTKINPDWRPFKGPLSSNSVKAAINLLGSFGRWLADAGYLNANPFSLMNRGVESASTIKNQMISKTVDVEHHFTPVEMLWMNTALTSLKDEAETKKRKSELIRADFILTFLRRTGLRREELVSVLNSNIKKVYLAKSGKTVYVLHGIGKGNKEFKLPFHKEVLDKLKIYRSDLGLTPMPSQEDDETILRTKTGKPFSTPTSLYRDFKKILSDIADCIENNHSLWEVNSDNVCDFEALISNIRIASPHWMRHSFITENAATAGDPRKLQLLARHSSLDMTAHYLHTTVEELTEIIERL